MALSKKELGVWGENQVVSFLKEKGATILHRNWTFKHLEIDIISEWNNTLHIIEVKTRLDTCLGMPNDWLNKKQQTNLINAADKYIEESLWAGETQFDLAAVLSEKPLKIKFIENAFIA